MISPAKVMVETTLASTAMSEQVEAALLMRTNALIYRGSLGTSVGNVFVGLVLLASNAQARTSPVAWVWLVGLMLVYSGRFWCATRYLQQAQQPKADQAVWRRYAIIGGLISGLWWAPGVALLWLAGTVEDNILLAIIVSGLLAGATSVLSAIPMAFVGFALPVWLSMVGCLAFSAHDVPHLVAALSSTTLFPMLLRATRKSHQEVEHSIRLSVEQAWLLEQLKHARDTALAAAGARSEFVAVMSHELRTPLNGVIGLTNLLLDTKLDVEQRELATGSKDSAQILLGLINGVLDLSKIDAGHLELDHRDFNLHDEMNSLRALFELRAKEKSLSLRIEVEPQVPRWVRGDWFRLRQVLVNLLGNAFKFTEHGTVTCRVRVGSNAPHTLSFEVSDSGIGITPEQQARLFQPFSQADASTARRFGGTGLGLVISKRLVTLMGGDLRLRSELGVGTTFTFDVNVGAALEAARPVELPAPLAIPSRERVLVCDDNEINLKVAGRLLEKGGYTVTLSRNGAEALLLLQHQRFDVVLMDLQMPVMDGFEALARARSSSPSVSEVPFVALTASASETERQACAKAGFAAFLTKPIDHQQLLRTVAEVCPAR